MAIPDDVSNANLNSGSDQPRLARADLNTLVLNFNTLLAHLRANPLAANGMGDGLSVVSSNIKVDVTSSDTVTIDCGTLV